MPKPFNLSQFISQLNQLPAPTQTYAAIDFFNPPDMTLEHYQQVSRITRTRQSVITMAFNSEDNSFLHLLISFFPVETLLRLLELALASGNMSLKTHDYFFGHERFYGYYLCWSQVGVIDRPDIGMLYSSCYEAKALIECKTTCDINDKGRE